MKKKRKIFLIILCIIIFFCGTIMSLYMYDHQMRSEYQSFALSGTVKLQSPDGKEYIKIFSFFPDENVISVSLEAQLPQLITLNNIGSILQIIDSHKTIQNFTVTGIYNETSILHKQLITLTFPITHLEKQYKLLYDRAELPIIISEVGPNHIQRIQKNIGISNGIAIAAFPQYNDQLNAEISLVPTGTSDAITSYILASEDITLLDDAGNRYTALANSNNGILIYNAKFADNLFLDISKIKVTFEGTTDPVEILGPWHISLKY